MSETLDEWVAVQRNWMYLETIFCAEDIQKQLPVEAAKFQAVDKMWKVNPFASVVNIQINSYSKA